MSNNLDLDDFFLKRKDIEYKENYGSFRHQTLNEDTKVDWLTPPEIIKDLGPFDTDPCTPINRPWDTATTHFNITHNGLLQDWSGRVWLNPPYGNRTKQWMKKMAEHNNGISLIFARTETKIFFPYVWDYADSIFFIKGRLNFYHIDGTKGGANSGAPSILIAYGKENTERLTKIKCLEGKLVYLK